MNHDEKLGLKIDTALLDELTQNAEETNRIPSSCTRSTR